VFEETAHPPPPPCVVLPLALPSHSSRDLESSCTAIPPAFFITAQFPYAPASSSLRSFLLLGFRYFRGSQPTQAVSDKAFPYLPPFPRLVLACQLRSPLILTNHLIRPSALIPALVFMRKAHRSFSPFILLQALFSAVERLDTPVGEIFPCVLCAPPLRLVVLRTLSPCPDKTSVRLSPPRRHILDFEPPGCRRNFSAFRSPLNQTDLPRLTTFSRAKPEHSGL